MTRVVRTVEVLKPSRVSTATASCMISANDGVVCWAEVIRARLMTATVRCMMDMKSENILY